MNDGWEFDIVNTSKKLAKSYTNSTRAKALRAEKEYEAYTASDEHQKKLAQANKTALEESMRRIFSTPGVSASDALIGVGQEVPTDSKERERKAMVEYYKQQMEAEENQRVTDANLKELESWSEEDRANLERYIAERDQHTYEAMAGQTQFDTYNLNPLIEKYGDKKVRQMAESVQWSRNAELMQDAEAAGKKTGDEHSVLGSGASVLTNLAGAYTGPLGFVKEMSQRTGQYSTFDPNNVGNLPAAFGGAVREQVTENIRGDGENWLRNLGALGYQGGMSALDSSARMVASGGSAGISSALAASGTFSSSIRQYSQQGASPEQAAAMAVVNAGLEYATEKLPTEEVLKLFKSGTTKGTIGKILAQAFLVEPTSEEVNLFAGVAAEAAILGDKSSQNQRIGEMVANGTSYQDARKQYFKELWKEAAQTYAVSAISGGMSATGAAVIGSVVNRIQNPEVGKAAAPAAKEAQQEQQEQPVQANAETPVVDERKQAVPSAEQLLEGIQDMTPAPEPLTEELQHFDNAAAIANGVQPAQQPAVDTDDSGSVRTQLRANQDSLNAMDPVANIQTPPKFSELPKSDRKAWVIKKLQPTGYKVDRKGFGIIKFAEKQLKSAFNYLKKGSVEEASFEALPYVLEYGTQISAHPVHKGREYGTVTFAAPVVINGKRGNMAVVVKQTTENFYKVHRILTPDGSVFDLSTMTNEAEPSLAGESPETGSLATPISSASDVIISETTPEVNENNPTESDYYDEFESWGADPNQEVVQDPLADRSYSEVGKRNVKAYTQNPYAEGGQSNDIPGGQQSVAEQNPGTVGAMQSQFKHEVKQSKVYGNTYQNTPYADIHDIGRAAKKADPNIDQYDVITEAESVHEAELRTETGRDRLAEHRALMKKDGWTGADNDTAMRLLTVYRREGKKDRFLELSRKQRQMGTQAGQMVQSFAKYSREDATVAVQDAIADLDELTIDQVDRTFWKPKQETKGAQGKKDAFQKWKESITGSLLEVANDIENVEDGDKAAMKDLVRQIANLRHTTAWAGYSSDLSRRTERGLDKMDFDTLKTVAKTQLSMIPNDFRKRDTGEILKQIRVQNMLFTLTTKFKNDAGNITNGIMDAISDSFGGRMIDAVIGKWTGKRTVGNDLKYATEYSKAARDAADVASAFVSLDIPMEVDAKYSSGRTRTWTPNTTNVFGRLMSAYEKHMKYALEVSDKFYEGGAAHVVNKSLQSLGEKSGLTPEQIQDIAQKTGERRTFKDPGASVDKRGQPKNGRMLARANVGLQKALNNIGTENIGLGDMVMPFAAVSGEVKQVGMDYTGGGLISGMKEIISIAKDVRNGKEIDPYRQRTAATNFGRGMTGVGLIAAFTAFAAAGAVKVHNDRDSEERMMNQTQGLSGAQWNLNSSLRWWEATMNGSTPEEAAKAAKWQSGDELITIDFLEPYNTQMHIGYLLSQGEDIPTAIMQGNFNSLLEMPMMQTLSDLADLQQAFTEVSDGDMDGVRDAAGQLVGTVAGSIVPNWMRKTAQVIDPYYRDTYDTKPFRKAAKEVVAATPFLSAVLPKKYDNLGKEQRRFDESEWMAATFDNLVTPWDTDTYQTNPVYQEIERLNAIDGINVTPPQAKRKITYTDNTGKKYENYNLSSEQYDTMQRIQGQTAKQVADEMIQLKDYAAMNDQQKAEAMKMAYQYAREKGRLAALEGYPELSGWMAGIDGKESEAIMRKVAADSVNKAMSTITAAWDNGWSDGDGLQQMEDAYATFAKMSKKTRDAVLGESTGRLKAYMEARADGVSTDTFAGLYRQYRDISNNENLDTTQKANQWAYVLENSAEKHKITERQKNGLRENLQFRYSMVAQTDKMDGLTESGIGAEDAKWIVDTIDQLTGTGSWDPDKGEYRVADLDKFGAIAGSDRLSDQEKDIAIKEYMPDFDPNATKKNYTELKYDFIRDEMGFSANDYVVSRKVISAGGKWRDMARDIARQTGCTEAVAYKLVQVIEGKLNNEILDWYNGKDE